MCSCRKTKTEVKDYTYTESGEIKGHSFVDLGLPSGRLWATCNVGANKPTEYGDYYAWGETMPKEDYTWDTYKYMSSSYHSLPDSIKNGQCINKYIVQRSHKAYYEYKLVFDNKTKLETIDDAATANWGNEWRMPTEEEQNEMQRGCDWFTTQNFNGSGIAGRFGISKTNGNIIFFPAAGCRGGKDLGYAGVFGSYWSSSLNERLSRYAYCFYFNFNNINCLSFGRFNGRSVRAVVR